MVDKTSAAMTSGLSADQMKGLPVGQDYRDLIRLIPGVQYTQDTTRGPSAGGSGQDNVYKFDGVNVTLPLFGTLSAEPASHDIAQVTVVKGGAQGASTSIAPADSRSTRSASPARTGSRGQVSYQFQNDEHDGRALNNGSHVAATSRTSRLDRPQRRRADRQGQAVLLRVVLPAGVNRDNGANVYGDAARLRQHAQRRLRQGDGPRRRSSVLVNVQLSRLASASDTSALFGANAARRRRAPATRRWQKIGTADGVVGHQRARASRRSKCTHFVNRDAGRPDNVVERQRSSTALGTQLDIANLDTHGPA